jgi:hypothetical protein
MNGQKDFEEWIEQTGHEKYEGEIRGMNIDPRFESLSIQPVTNPLQLSSYTKYRTPSNSPLRTTGLSLRTELGIEVGSFDFNQNGIPPKGTGASF